MRLSEHFSLEELTYTSHRAFSNTPTSSERYHLKLLCEKILEPLRHAMNDEPMIINSGFREKALNTFVGGAKNSYHTRGLAADIRCKSCEHALNMAFYAIHEKLPFAELILCKSVSAGTYWLHVALAMDSDKKHYIGAQMYG